MVLKTQRSVDLQNLTRGVLGVSRSHDFRKNGPTAKHTLKGQIRQLLILAGKKIPPSQYADYVLWAEKLITSLAPGVDPTVAPDYLSLSNLYEVSEADFSRTLSWVEARLSPHKEKLKYFFSGCALAEKKAFEGDLPGAEKVLEELEAHYGPSVHLVELRLSISQLKDGVEGQKKIAAVMRGAGKGGLIGLIIYFVSIRNESRLSFTSYREQVEKRADKFKDKRFSKYIRYRLLKDSVFDESTATAILQVEENHTIFDLAYTTHKILSSSDNLSQSAEAKRVLACTKDIFSDQDNASVSNMHELGIDVTHSKSIKELYRLVARGFQKHRRRNLALFRVYGFCRAALSPRGDHRLKSLLDFFGNCLASEFLGHTYSGQDNDFRKAVLNFSCFPQSQALFDELCQLYVDDCHEKFGAPFAKLDIEIARHFAVPQVKTGVLEPIVRLLELRRNQKREYLIGFLSFCESLESEVIFAPIFIWLEIAKAIVNIHLQNPGEVSRIVASLALDFNVRLDNLPIRSFYEKLSWKSIAKDANLTQTAIAIELFSRTIDSTELDAFKKYSIEDLLIKCKKNVPSQLSMSDCQVSLRQYHYFMSVLCTQKNMEMLHALKGTAHLDNERKNILSMLAHTDKDNASTYNAEILGILHKSRIAHGVALIDRSRIHVDEDPLVNKLSINLVDRWNRYKSVETATEPSLADLTSVLRTIEKSDEDSEVFKVPKNEGSSLLLELLASVQDAFLHDIDHGLDRYLGHRIRHNAFANQVRGGLSESHILTKKINGSYQYSDHWSERLANEDPRKRLLALEAMREFSKNFDAAIEEIQEKMFRVRKQNYPEALFDVQISGKAYYLISRFVSTDSNLPTFVSSCFQLFWQLLLPSLGAAKRRVGSTFSGEVSALFAKLLKEITSLELQESLVLESSIVQAKNDTSKAIDQVVTWFNKSAIDENSHIYSVKDAVDIVVEACVSARKGAEPRVTVNANGNIDVHPPALYQLSDIFWIVIDNACAHCGFDRGVEIKVDVDAFSEQGLLTIKASNFIDQKCDIVSISDAIKAIKHDIDNKNYSEKLMVEGKSGLKKLAALALKKHGGGIDFGIKDAMFFLNLKIPLAAVYIPEKGEKK